MVERVIANYKERRNSMNAMLVVIVGIIILIVGIFSTADGLPSSGALTTPKSPPPMSWRTVWTTSPLRLLC